MAFFNKMLASIGIGSAKVDTRLESQRLHAGEAINGTIHITGGNVEQRIDNIYLQLMTQYIRSVNDSKVRETATIARYKVASGLIVPPNEKLELPFSIDLPYDCPVSLGRQPVWLRTELDIEMAVDPSDNDAIEVLPHPHVGTVLDALGALGFRLRSSQCEHYPRGGRLPFIQEFEFIPTARFRGQLEEIEAVFYPSEEGVGILLEIDRRMHGLAGMFSQAFDLDLEESKHKVFIPAEQIKRGPDAIAVQLANLIQSRL
jgi:sporulation-control protein